MPLTEKRVYLYTLLALTLLSIFCIWTHVPASGQKAVPAVVQAKSASLKATANGIVLNLSGAISDQATKASLINAAEKVFGLANVVDQIEVKANLAEPAWIEQAKAMFPLLKSTIKNGVFVFKDKTVEVRGEVSGEESKTKILRSIDNVTGSILTVNDQLQTPNTRAAKGKKAGPMQIKLNELLLGKTIEFDSSSNRLRSDNNKIARRDRRGAERQSRHAT